MTSDYQSGARVRHKKRGSTYKVIGHGTLQTTEPIEDMRGVTAYQSEEDGRLWVRPSSEFIDGRFEPLPADPASGEGAEHLRTWGLLAEAQSYGKMRDAEVAALRSACVAAEEVTRTFAEEWGLSEARFRRKLAALRAALEKATGALKAYEALEADLVLNGDWSGSGVAMSQEQHDNMMGCQALRNEALAALASLKAPAP